MADLRPGEAETGTDEKNAESHTLSASSSRVSALPVLDGAIASDVGSASPGVLYYLLTSAVDAAAWRAHPCGKVPEVNRLAAWKKQGKKKKNKARGQRPNARRNGRGGGGKGSDGGSGDPGGRRTLVRARYVTEGTNVMSENTWDDVEFTEEDAAAARERVEAIPVLADTAAVLAYDEAAAAHWDDFYSKNRDNFFKVSE